MIKNKMNPLLTEDIFIQICYQINNVKLIMTIQQVSKWHKKIVRKNKWIGLTVNIKNDENLVSMLKTHNFRNLRCVNITDINASKLVNVHTLDLGYTNVTNLGVSKLVNVHTLDLRATRVTDESISKLVNAHTLYLSYTRVTDKSVSKLVKAHTFV